MGLNDYQSHFEASRFRKHMRPYLHIDISDISTNVDLDLDIDVDLYLDIDGSVSIPKYRTQILAIVEALAAQPPLRPGNEVPGRRSADRGRVPGAQYDTDLDSNST